MPRVARLDTPGLLHHVMIRGIERRKIFNDDKDRENLIERLSILLPETKTQCYAWSFLSNHAHFLLRSSPGGIAALMRRLLTGYAVYYNRRHKRHQQLFQNRYKSIICQEDSYLQELVRYTFIGHAGAVDGYYGRIAHNPETDTTIVVFFNNLSAREDVLAYEGFLHDLIDIF